MHGIAIESIVPIRASHSEKEEMVSQLLFGEPIEIIESKKNWTFIKSNIDGYEGWVDSKMIEPISDEEFELFYANKIVCNQPYRIFPEGIGYSIDIEPGSYLPSLDNFKIKAFHYVVGKINSVKPLLGLNELVDYYLGSPYLWGGKSKGGIDCSGFTQLVYRVLGKEIDRDASKQAEEKGEMIEFITESKPGDLAFFDNEEGRITHVGIILNNHLIVHASGRVRIDRIDQEGIFNTSTMKYTHKLRFVKRLK